MFLSFRSATLSMLKPLTSNGFMSAKMAEAIARPGMILGNSINHMITQPASYTKGAAIESATTIPTEVLTLAGKSTIHAARLGVDLGKNTINAIKLYNGYSIDESQSDSSKLGSSIIDEVTKVWNEKDGTILGNLANQYTSSPFTKSVLDAAALGESTAKNTAGAASNSVKKISTKGAESAFSAGVAADFIHHESEDESEDAKEDGFVSITPGIKGAINFDAINNCGHIELEAELQSAIKFLLNKSADCGSDALENVQNITGHNFVFDEFV